MAKTARLTSELTLDDSAFQAGIRRATNSATKFGQELNARGGQIALAGITAGAVAAAAAFATLGAAIKTGLDVGGQFADLSKRIGDLPGSIAVISKGFEAGGLGADELSGAIGRMQKALVGGSDAFAKLGLNAGQLQSMAPTEALVAVGNAIAAIKDPAEQTAAAMEIFGKSGAALKQVFGDNGALALAREALGSMPAILNESGGLLDEMGDKVGHLSTKWQAFSVGITAGLAPVLNPLLDKMISADTAAFGKGLGDDIANAFKGQTVGQAILDLSLKFSSAMAIAAKAAGASIAAELEIAFGPYIDAMKLAASIANPVGAAASFGKAAATTDRRSDAQKNQDAAAGYMQEIKDLFPNTADPDKPRAATGPTKTAAAAASPNATASAGLLSGTGTGGGGSDAGGSSDEDSPWRQRLSHASDMAAGRSARTALDNIPKVRAQYAAQGQPFFDAMEARKSAIASLTSQNREGFFRGVGTDQSLDTRSNYDRNYAPNSGPLINDGHGGSRIDGDGVRRAANMLDVGRKDDGFGGSRLRNEDGSAKEAESMLRKAPRQVSWVKKQGESQEEMDARVAKGKGGDSDKSQGDPNAAAILSEIRNWNKGGKS